MNNTEIYFARQNALWNISGYIIIAIVIFAMVLYIGSWIYENWLESLIKKIKEKKKGKIKNGRK